MLHKWLRLPSSDRRLLLRAMLVVGVTRLGLWLLPLAKVRRLAEKVKPAKSLRDTTSPDRVAWAVLLSSRFVPQSTCLVKAVAVQTLLAHMGVNSKLQIGVGLGQQQQFQAHAWVEYQGRVLIGGAESENYMTLLSLDRQ